MSAETLLARLEHARRAGPGRWRARCPAHGGKNRQSLAVREMDDGRVLLFCHAHECSADAIVGAVGLELDVLFPPRDLPAGEHRRPPERLPFDPRDILAAVADEIAIAYVIVHDIAHGAPITADIRDRLLVAASRLARAEEAARGC